MNDTSLTISALGGFASYHWETGDTTQSITVNPNLYDTLTCSVTTFLGCQLNLYYILDAAPGHPNFTYTAGCNGLVQFTNISVANYSPINYLWTFFDGTTSTLQNPTHTFNSNGNVTLQVSSNLGCSKDTTIPVVLPPVPNPRFTVPNVCLGQTSVFTNTTPQIPGYNLIYSWDLGIYGVFSSTNLTYVYPVIGPQYINLTATTNGNPPCSVTYHGQTTIYAIPGIIGPIIHN